MLSRKSEPSGLNSRSQRMTRFKKYMVTQKQLPSETAVPTSHKIVQLIQHFNLGKADISFNTTPKHFSPMPIERRSNLSNASKKHSQHLYSESLDRRRLRTQTKAQLSANKTKSTFLSRVMNRNDISLSQNQLNQDQFKVELTELRNSFVHIESQRKKKSSFFQQHVKKTPYPYLQPMRKNTQHLEQSQNEKTIRKSAPRIKRQLQQYLKYIHAPTDIHYGNQTSYDNMRELSKKQSAEKFNIKTAYAIENIFLMIYETMIGEGKIKTDRKEDAIRQLCQFYFGLDGKGQLETLVCWSFLKGFMGKLRQFFVLQKMALYYIVLLNQQVHISKSQLQQLSKKIIYELHLAYAILIQIVLETIQQGDTSNKINYTFKVLKSMCEVEKNLENVLLDLKKISKQANIKEICEIQRQFQWAMDRTRDSSKFQERINRIEMDLSWRYLKIPPVPYLPQLQKPTYTLVLDLDQTLIHYDQPSELLKFRPSLRLFLDTLSKLYQIVLFTASQKDYADKIIKELDPDRIFFKYRLYGEHTSVQSKRILKDITKLGRDLKKIVVVDNQPEMYRNCIMNTVIVESWLGERTDTALGNLLPVLRDVADRQVDDVREYFKSQKVTLAHISQENQESVSSIVRG